MLTAVDCRQKRRELIPVLERLGMADIRSLDWDNKMLAIHTMQNALEIVPQSQMETRQIIMINLAYCYEDRGFFHEAIYWYKRCLKNCGCMACPLLRLHIQGSLMLSLIESGSMPEAEQLLRDIPGDISDIGGGNTAHAYADQRRALALYFSCSQLSMEAAPDHTEITAAVEALLALCGAYDGYLLMHKIQLGALEIHAAQSAKSGALDNAVDLYKQAAAAAFAAGRKKKAAECRRAVSGIYESMGNLRQAWYQYKKYYQLSTRICRKKSEEFSRYLSAIHNLSETDQELSSLREMKEYLSLKRNTDALTGVCNRRFWEESLEQKAAGAGPDTVFSIFMLDIDSFKKYNDTFGHLEGDKALQAIGGLLKGCVRANADVLARFGGDEFVILAEGMDVTGSKLLAARILTGIRDYPFLSGVTLTVSIGVSTGKIGWERSFKTMLGEADAALYHAKKHGKDRSTHRSDIQGDG